MKSILFLLLLLIGFNASSQAELVQLRPQTEGDVPKNELLELEIPFDSATWSKVHRFVYSGISSGLNPYDPEKIDITAEFFIERDGQWVRKGKTFGFYFQDFFRDTTADIERWSWRKIGRDKFLVRYAPNEIGKWKVEVSNHIKGIETPSKYQFVFNCIDSPRQGKMQVKGTHFEVDGRTFVPIGNNLSHPRWMNDPIALRQGTAEYWNDIHELPAMPIAYVNFLQDLDRFSNAGGNYFRYMHFPFVNDIEFEKLNDYTDRLHIAWETDKIIEKCEEHDLRMHFVLTWANELNSPERTYNKLFWDWWADNYPYVDDDHGYCYQHALGLTEPHEFLTDRNAIHYYKKKLRYMFSRWGYSSAIGVIELMNEINLVFEKYPVERMKWHDEISTYLRTELEQTNPISVNYGGPPNMSEGDSSYYLPYVDVITFNEYRIPGLRGNFTQHLANYRSIGKPFMFSEIGAGYGELADCEVFSEWLKDAWMTTLSGMAGMGLEWSQQRNFELMSRYYPLINSFLSKIDIGTYTAFESDSRKDKMAEIVAIKDLINGKAAGVVHNTTWNFYTNRQGDEVPCGKTEPQKIFSEYEDVADRMGRNALHLNGFERRKRYVIEWYDGQSGLLVGTTEDKSSMNGKVRMRIPPLTPKTSLLVFQMTKQD